MRLQLPWLRPPASKAALGARSHVANDGLANEPAEHDELAAAAPALACRASLELVWAAHCACAADNFQENFFFLDWAAEQIRRDGTIRLPFGSGRTSPVSTQDVAEVVASILVDPTPHIGKIYELTGPRSEDLRGLSSEYAAALGLPVRYAAVPLEEWRDKELRAHGLPEHVYGHFLTMAELHAANRYDRLTSDVEAVLGRPARPIESMVRENRDKFCKAQV